MSRVGLDNNRGAFTGGDVDALTNRLPGLAHPSAVMQPTLYSVPSALYSYSVLLLIKKSRIQVHPFTVTL